MEVVVEVEHMKEQKMELRGKEVRLQISCCFPESTLVDLLGMDWGDLVGHFFRVPPNHTLD
jgi:hypothetical protein